MSQNFTVTAGTDLDMTVRLLDTAGDPLTLTAPTGQWTVATKPNPEAGDILLTKTPALANVAGTWTATWSIAAADTDDIDPGAYYHWLRFTDDGKSYVAMAGFMTVEPSF